MITGQPGGAPSPRESTERAVVPGLLSFAVFFLVCALVLEELGAWRGFAAASAITLAAHALLMCAMWRLARRAPPIRQVE